MELCKEVPAVEYVIPVVEVRTSFHNNLRFSLLASSWFPRALGVLLWSVLHMILVVFVPRMLLGSFTLLVVLAIFVDAFHLLCVTLLGLLVIIIVVTVVWVWLKISRQCYLLPARSPGQSMAQYILSAGGVLNPPIIVTAQPSGEGPAEGGTAATDEDLECRVINVLPSLIVLLFKHVALVSFPYWRLRWKSLCRVVVPLYDAVVVGLKHIQTAEGSIPHDA